VNTSQHRPRTSRKADSFAESVIREMTREATSSGAINLAQGFPDFPAPDFIKQAAVEAIQRDINQYSLTWGSKSLRRAIAGLMNRLYGLDFDPEQEITVCCGATEGMMAAMLAVVDPGDEVIVFEPFYENYGPDAVLSGAVPKYVTLHPPDFTFREEDLRDVFGSRTKAIIINTPHNPTGRVFSKSELETIAHYCIEHDVIAITDEIYEHITYDSLEHTPMAAIEDMRDRTITVNGVSKTFSVTGWRVGYVIAPPEMTSAVRKVHDFLTVGAPAPLQEAAAQALNTSDGYYAALRDFYAERRDYFYSVLQDVGFQSHRPSGAYYIMADISKWGFRDDMSFARFLGNDIGVAVVPGSSFYRAGSREGSGIVRFCFCKKMETLEAAAERLRGLNDRA
jgi:aspartate/methionine/tyrosine aminotransferase